MAQSYSDTTLVVPVQRSYPNPILAIAHCWCTNAGASRAKWQAHPGKVTLAQPFSVTPPKSIETLTHRHTETKHCTYRSACVLLYNADMPSGLEVCKSSGLPANLSWLLRVILHYMANMFSVCPCGWTPSIWRRRISAYEKHTKELHVWCT